MTELYHPREDWQDLREPISGPAPKGTPGTWVIHYPGSSSNYEPTTDAQVTQYLRSTQSSYKENRGYSLGYSYGLSQSGSAWEIRGNEFNNAANAGRKVEGNFNHVSQSIFIMVGNQNEASSKAVAKANAIIATQPSWNIIIHGDVDYTSCCGNGLIHQVRTGVIGHQDSGTSSSGGQSSGSDGYNPPDKWGLFPLDSNKPTIRNGSENSHVVYLQDVIYFYAGGDIYRDGDFGDQTERRVKDVQGMFGITVDGWVGPETWEAIDYIVTINMEEPESTEPTKPAAEPTKPAAEPTKPAAEPTKPAADVEAIEMIAWYVNKGDSPWSVGKEIYQSGQEGADKLNSDSFNGYSTPRVPVFVDTPDISGRKAAFQSGEGAYAILRRMGYEDNDANLGILWKWNGGSERVFHAGDVIHMT
jgi:peptidoglycan hydrolase-like protein with peptidoglycan-binding domain